MKRSYYRILRLLREKSLSYNEILEQMWGIYPKDLNKAIKWLKEEDLIIEEASGIYQAKEVSTNDYCEIDKDYIQFGSAGWFWDRQVNTYVLQVEPDRYRFKDRVFLDYREALHVEKIRDLFFQKLDGIIQSI